MGDVTPAELEILKSRFRAADCKVADLNDAGFEIVGTAFPVRTHVFVTPYYLQLSTCIVATPRAHVPDTQSEIEAFLNVANRRAKLVKFTVDVDVRDPAGDGWPIFASVRLVTGVVGLNYDSVALENLTMLWFQDIAELIAFPDRIELRAMMSDVRS